MTALINPLSRIYDDPRRRRLTMTPPFIPGGETQDMLGRIPASALEVRRIKPDPNFDPPQGQPLVEPVRFQQPNDEELLSQTRPRYVNPPVETRPAPSRIQPTDDLSSSGPPVFSSMPPVRMSQDNAPLLRASTRLPGVVERIPTDTRYGGSEMSQPPVVQPTRIGSATEEVGNFGLPVVDVNVPPPALLTAPPDVMGAGVPASSRAVSSMPPVRLVPRDPAERRAYLEARGVPAEVQEWINAGEARPRMRDHSTDAPRGWGAKVLHGLEHFGKGTLQGARIGSQAGLGGAIGGAIAGGIGGAVSPEFADRMEYNTSILPRWQAENDYAQKQADARLGRIVEYARISGVNPVTGEPTPTMERFNQMGERYDDLNRQAQARLEDADRRIAETERHNKATEERIATTQAQSQKMGRARFILNNYRAGGPLTQADRQTLKYAGYEGADDMPESYDPASVRLVVGEDGEYKMMVVRPQSGSLQTRGTGVKRQPSGGGRITGQQAGVVAGEVYRQLGFVKNGRMAHPDLAREVEAVKQRVNANPQLKEVIESQGLTVDDYAKRQAAKNLQGKGEIVPGQHPSVQALSNWMQLRGGVDPQKFSASVKHYMDAIGKVRASGLSPEDQEKAINELKSEFSKRTGGADLGWFQ